MSTERHILLTDDGSATVATADGVTYHSRYGAMQESRHVYIQAGLDSYASEHWEQSDIAIFEMGLGTGLNALLSRDYVKERGLRLYYEAVELYPLNDAEVAQLNYPDRDRILPVIHTHDWDNELVIAGSFLLRKVREDLATYVTSRQFHIIYFDAFAPEVQPELWTEAIFRKMYAMLVSGGIMVTYCSKGTVRRAMTAAGFRIEKLPGPKGKREILRAIRPVSG